MYLLLLVVGFEGKGKLELKFLFPSYLKRVLSTKFFFYFHLVSRLSWSSPTSLAFLVFFWLPPRLYAFTIPHVSRLYVPNCFFFPSVHPLAPHLFLFFPWLPPRLYAFTIPHVSRLYVPNRNPSWMIDGWRRITFLCVCVRLSEPWGHSGSNTSPARFIPLEFRPLEATLLMEEQPANNSKRFERECCSPPCAHSHRPSAMSALQG